MNKLKFIAISAAQNIMVVMDYLTAGIKRAKKNFALDLRDYHNAKVLESRKVFKN